MGHPSRMLTLDAAGRAAAGPKQTARRFQLDYATWRAHLAAPGSRFEPAPSASPRIVHLDAVSRPAVPAGAERRTA